MERAILIADQTGGMPVSVRDAREVNDDNGAARVIQLVSQVARPAGDVQPGRADYVSAPDSAENLDGQLPVVAGAAGSYLSDFQVWGPGLRRSTVTTGQLWWGVVYNGSLTIVKIYPSDPTGGGITPLAQGSISSRGGWVMLGPVNDSGILGGVNVAGTVITDDEQTANTLTFQDWFLDRLPLGDCGGRIGISIWVNNFTAFTSVDVTPVGVMAGGSLLARLETKQFQRGSVDFSTPYAILMLPVQWWEVQGIEEIAVHITAIGGGGGVYPQIIRG